jgi:hypothetical protein
MTNTTYETATGRSWAYHGGLRHVFGYRGSICGEAPKADEGSDGPTCGRCVELSGAGDYILKAREGAARRYRFPTLCIHGAGCGGYVSFSWDGETIRRPDVTLHLALIQYGHTVMGGCDNSPPTHACDCEERLAELGDPLAAVGVESDTGWVGARGGRCITDYARTVQFVRPPTGDELDQVKEYLIRKNCPGWTPLACVEDPFSGGTKFCFKTTMDSSD